MKLHSGKNLYHSIEFRKELCVETSNLDISHVCFTRLQIQKEIQSNYKKYRHLHITSHKPYLKSNIKMMSKISLRLALCRFTCSLGKSNKKFAILFFLSRYWKDIVNHVDFTNVPNAYTNPRNQKKMLPALTNNQL